MEVSAGVVSTHEPPSMVPESDKIPNSPLEVSVPPQEKMYILINCSLGPLRLYCWVWGPF